MEINKKWCTCILFVFFKLESIKPGMNHASDPCLTVRTKLDGSLGKMAWQSGSTQDTFSLICEQHLTLIHQSFDGTLLFFVCSSTKHNGKRRIMTWWGRLMASIFGDCRSREPGMDGGRTTRNSKRLWTETTRAALRIQLLACCCFTISTPTASLSHWTVIHHKLDSLDEHIYPLTGATGKELYPPHRRGVGSKIPEKPEGLRLVAQGRTGEIT
jgi:hypothetical protein